MMNVLLFLVSFFNGFFFVLGFSNDFQYSLLDPFNYTDYNENVLGLYLDPR